MDESEVIVGRVVRAHGLRGELVVQTTTPGSDVLFHVDAVVVDHRGTRVRRKLRKTREQGRATVISIESCDDRNASEAMVGAQLLLRRSELPPPSEGEVYVSSLIGLPVVDPQGNVLGVVADFEDGGMQSWLVLEANQIRWLVPFTEPMVQVEPGRVVLDAPEGLLDPAVGEPVRQAP
jgi:16S rRNA processing protein RimM